MVSPDLLLLIACLLILGVGIYLHKCIHESIESRLNAMFDRLCSLEALPKSEPIVPPAPSDLPAVPKKRRSTRKKE